MRIDGGAGGSTLSEAGIDHDGGGGVGDEALGCQMHVVLLSSLKGTGHTQHKVKLLGLGGSWSKAKTPPALDARAGSVHMVCGSFPDGGGELGFTAQAH